MTTPGLMDMRGLLRTSRCESLALDGAAMAGAYVAGRGRARGRGGEGGEAGVRGVALDCTADRKVIRVVGVGHLGGSGVQLVVC